MDLTGNQAYRTRGSKKNRIPRSTALTLLNITGFTSMIYKTNAGSIKNAIGWLVRLKPRAAAKK